MDAAQTQLDTLLELEARHDELLDQLGELDKRVQKVLAECSPQKSTDCQLTCGDPDAPTC